MISITAYVLCNVLVGAIDTSEGHSTPTATRDHRKLRMGNISLMQCVVQCVQKDSCIGVLFHQFDSVCVLQGDRFDPQLFDMGFKYFLKKKQSSKPPREPYKKTSATAPREPYKKTSATAPREPYKKTSATAPREPYKKNSHLLVFSYDRKETDRLVDIDTFSSTPFPHLQNLPGNACRYVDSTGELLVGTEDFIPGTRAICKIYLVNLHSYASRVVFNNYCTAGFWIDEEMGLVFFQGNQPRMVSANIIRMTPKGDNIKILKTFQNHKRIALDVVHKLIYFSGETNTISSLTYEGKLSKPIVSTEKEELTVLLVDKFMPALYYTNMSHFIRRSLIPPRNITMAMGGSPYKMIGYGRSVYWINIDTPQFYVLTDGKTFTKGAVPIKIATLCTIP